MLYDFTDSRRSVGNSEIIPAHGAAVEQAIFGDSAAVLKGFTTTTSLCTPPVSLPAKFVISKL